uniref:ORF57c n=1 Tax=Pinus koraiensis TaxID=88728 RepID=Q85X06_PINKO|nr:ORF57c [Pinus koraiensis]
MVRCLTGWRNEDDSKQSSISIRRLYSAKISNSAKISSRLIPMINHYRPFEQSFTLFV